MDSLMKKTKDRRKMANPKGKRLNWTPVDKAEKVSLKKLNVTGKKVPSDVIQRGKKFVDTKERLLIP